MVNIFPCTPIVLFQVPFNDHQILYRGTDLARIPNLFTPDGLQRASIHDLLHAGEGRRREVCPVLQAPYPAQGRRYDCPYRAARRHRQSL